MLAFISHSLVQQIYLNLFNGVWNPKPGRVKTLGLEISHAEVASERLYQNSDYLD